MNEHSSDLFPYYQILEVEPGASLEEIKRAYREQTKIWHPDRFPADDFRLQSKAQEKLKQINWAYEVLCGRGAWEPPSMSSRPATSPSPSRAHSAPSPAYTPPSDSDKRSTVGAKITYCLRWLAVIPGALLASILSTFPLHLALYYMLTEFIDPYPELPERILTPGVIAGAFVWAGAKIAPARKIETAIVLFGLWTLLIGGFLAVALFKVKIGSRYIGLDYGGFGIAAAFIGGVVGFLVIRNEAET